MKAYMYSNDWPLYSAEQQFGGLWLNKVIVIPHRNSCGSCMCHTFFQLQLEPNREYLKDFMNLVFLKLPDRGNAWLESRTDSPFNKNQFEDRVGACLSNLCHRFVTMTRWKDRFFPRREVYQTPEIAVRRRFPGCVIYYWAHDTGGCKYLNIRTPRP